MIIFFHIIYLVFFLYTMILWGDEFWEICKKNLVCVTLLFSDFAYWQSSSERCPCPMAVALEWDGLQGLFQSTPFSASVILGRKYCSFSLTEHFNRLHCLCTLAFITLEPWHGERSSLFFPLFCTPSLPRPPFFLFFSWLWCPTPSATGCLCLWFLSISVWQPVWKPWGA